MPLRFFVCLLICSCSLSIQAQTPPYPRNYFRNPMGIPLQLSANFGELRPNHWHMGLDIRTNAQENYPVYAAAEGYIAHIGVRASSFGRFIIIRHPNGLSTLYAHLNDFFPALEEFVRAKQKEKESWPIELDFTKEQFPVSKGAFIAYSGNTGGSQGPHLHFEIMDTRTEKRLNPLLFDFGLKDDVPPTLSKLAIYDRSKSVYDQSPFFYTLKNTDSGYIIPKIPVINTGLKKISFALAATDRLSGSNNPNGIYSAKLYLDEEPQLAFILDSISYDETAYMNAHVDFKMRYNGGGFIQHLSRMPGDLGAAYHPIKNDGVIEFNDTLLHAVSIDVSDAHGNRSTLNFMIRYYDSLAKPSTVISKPLVIAPTMVSVVEKPGFEMYISDKAVYDTVATSYFVAGSASPYVFSDIHQVGEGSVPVHDDLVVRLKLKRKVPEEWQDKLIILRGDRKGSTVRKAVWQEQWLSAKFSDFGSYQLIADVQPPQINSLGSGDTVNLSAASRIVFTPTDNYGIKSFKAILYSCTADTLGYHCSGDSLSAGQWLRFTNDKGRNSIYRFDETCPYGVHKLKVTVEDLVGNTSTREWWFKRYPYTAPPPKKTSSKKGKGTKTIKKANEKAKKDVKKTVKKTKK
ncbi:MAG: M23 family metallopeptidase [Chitinophagaceae bacterium]|nr:M23 family metallopeptidase [Chitinophagaceae bacterium]